MKQTYPPFCLWRRTLLWVCATVTLLLGLIGYAPFVPGGTPLVGLCFLALAGCYLALLFSRSRAALFAISGTAVLAMLTMLYYVFDPDAPRWNMASHGLLLALCLFPLIFPALAFAALPHMPRAEGKAHRVSSVYWILAVLVAALLLVPAPQRIRFDTAPLQNINETFGDTTYDVAVAGWALDWLVLPDRFVGTLTLNGEAYTPTGRLSRDFAPYRMQKFQRSTPDGARDTCTILFTQNRAPTPAYVSVWHN